jgi:hypothetical protein
MKKSIKVNFLVTNESLKAWYELQNKDYNMSRLMRTLLIDFYHAELAKNGLKKRGTFDPDDSSIGE